MKDALILEVAARWEAEAAKSMNNKQLTFGDQLRENGHREALRQCADTLRMLVSTVGDSDPGDNFTEDEICDSEG